MYSLETFKKLNDEEVARQARQAKIALLKANLRK